MVLAELLGVRKWPAVVAWTIVFPIVYIVESVLWGNGAPGPPQITIVGAAVAGSVFLLNRWYFPKFESYFVQVHNARGVSPLTNPRAATRVDFFAIMLWVGFTYLAFQYDWQNGNLCWFPNPAALRLWGCVVSAMSKIGYAYLYLVGSSLLFHYSSHWVTMGKEVRLSNPPTMPEGDDRKGWAEWQRARASYLEKVKESANLFFIGFVALIAVVITSTWAWIVFWSIGWASVLDPHFLASEAFIVVSLVIYFQSPSIAAWWKIERAQKVLRQKAISLLSQDESEEDFPSLSATLLSLSDESVLSLRHGTPIVAFGFFLSYVVGFIIRYLLGV